MERQFLTSTLLIFACFLAKAHINSNSLPKTNATDSGQYAILYVYTTSYFHDYYMLDIDSSAVCPIFTNSKFEINLYKEGSTLVSVEDKSVKINVEFGKEYYMNFEVSNKAFRSNSRLDLISADEGKLAYQKIIPDSFSVDNKSYMGLPKFQEPPLWCIKIQSAWNNLLAEHGDIKNKFDSLPGQRSYYFYIVYHIDTAGKLVIHDPDKSPGKIPKIDSICARLLYGLLEETHWEPAYIKKKNENNRTPVEMQGHSFFTITSKGFESVVLMKRIYYPRFSTVPFDDRVFYSCNCGK